MKRRPLLSVTTEANTATMLQLCLPFSFDMTWGFLPIFLYDTASRRLFHDSVCYSGYGGLSVPPFVLQVYLFQGLKPNTDIQMGDTGRSRALSPALSRALSLSLFILSEDWWFAYRVRFHCTFAHKFRFSMMLFFFPLQIFWSFGRASEYVDLPHYIMHILDIFSYFVPYWTCTVSVFPLYVFLSLFCPPNRTMVNCGRATGCSTSLTKAIAEWLPKNWLT